MLLASFSTQMKSRLVHLGKASKCSTTRACACSGRPVFALPRRFRVRAYANACASNPYFPICNALAAKDFSRKFIAFYMGVENLGDLLKHEAFWLPVAVLRSTFQREIIGGVSATYCALLRRVFTDPTSTFKDGALVTLDVGPRLLFPEYAGHLADESALHAMLCVKGSSGTR